MFQNTSLRLRLNALFALLLATALAVGLATIALKAGPRIRAEDDSVMRLSREFVEVALESLRATPEPERAVAALMRGLTNLRHVRVSIERGGEPPAAEAPAGVPRWFANLVAPESETMRVPVVIAGRDLGEISIASNPWDEIAEIWDAAVTLVAGGVALIVAVGLLNFLFVGRSLRPIGAIEGALARLAGGDYATRLAPEGPPELRNIGAGLNALAEALALARRENRTLAQRLVRAQDDERKQLAHELHDEFGPHLFGIRAHASAILASARKIGAADIAGNCDALLGQVAALQDLNRGVLSRLRPAAYGELGLSASLAALVDPWRMSHPDVDIDMRLPDDLDAIDEVVGLTLYRIAQEGLTNVFRHSGATRVEIDVARAPSGLRVRVRDNGRGLRDSAPGFGLRGMRERVAALAGEISARDAPEGGVVIEATLPTG